MPVATKTLAPGARVSVRDEEWVVRNVQPTTFGGLKVDVVGVSELVRDKHAIFLTQLDRVVELKPEETALVNDGSPGYRRSRLFLESLLRRTPPTDARLVVGHRGALEHQHYQLEPAAKALAQPRSRLLIADGVGLGKTVEVGILLSELIRRGRGRRILVVALKSILAQFQEELWGRFTIPLVRLDSVGIQRVQAKIPSRMNPFHFFDRVIISIDTLKKDEKYRRYLEQCRWDVVVVDECQNVADRAPAGRGSQRSRLARLLAQTADSLILTSATPHDGKAESFASLIRLLEPTAIADPDRYGRDDVQDLFIRRFKKDVAASSGKAFHDRRLELKKIDASTAEDAVFVALESLKLRATGRTRGGAGFLFETLLLKAFLSSPAACVATIRARLKRLEDRDDVDAAHDRAALESLAATVEVVEPDAFRKYQALLAWLLERDIGQRGGDGRVVIFTERVDTLRFLEDRLTEDLKLGKGALEIFHGSLDDRTQQDLVTQFGKEDTKLRVLLATDVASEGINLHYFCHRLVHFDLPWSLITLEQRNGRIDRFGQDREPEIAYLLTIPGESKTRGDLRVLERLVAKEDAAHRNLGDVAWLMDLHDSEREEERIALAIERQEAPEAVIPDAPKAVDLLALLQGDGGATPSVETDEPLRLLPDDYEYAREALQLVANPDDVEWHEHLRGIILDPPPDLARRLEFLPPELRQDGGRLKLSADRDRIMTSVAKARLRVGAWPEWQLLWELHPVLEWLDDRVLAEFGRHEAPTLRVRSGLEPGSFAYVFQAQVANEVGQPVLAAWFAVVIDPSSHTTVRPFDDLARACRLDAEPVNPGPVDDATLARATVLLPTSVEAARRHVKALLNERVVAIAGPAVDDLLEVTRWRDASLKLLGDQQVAIEARRTLRSDERKRLDAERRDIEATYDDRKRWFELLAKLSAPHLRVAAVLVGD